MRFTLPKLFLAVAMLALACAGMTYRTRWWADGIVSLTVLLYTVMALRVIGLCGRQRAFAIIFSITGACYLLLMTTNVLPIIRDSILSDHALAFILKITPSSKGVGVFVPVEDVFMSGVTYKYILGTHQSQGVGRYGSSAFFLIGHCVWSWLFALLAGWFAGRMYDQRERQLAAASPPTSTSANSTADASRQPSDAT